MKPGKRRSKLKPGKGQPPGRQEAVAAQSNPVTAPEPQAAPPPVAEKGEGQEGPAIVPVNLLAALEKMRDGGAVPVFITRELEKFLTEQGVYRDDMRPAEAWQKLDKIAGNAPEPEPPAAS